MTKKQQIQGAMARLNTRENACKAQLKEKALIALFFLFLFIVYGFVGAMDYQDAVDKEQRQNQNNKTMVAAK